MDITPVPIDLGEAAVALASATGRVLADKFTAGLGCPEEAGWALLDMLHDARRPMVGAFERTGLSHDDASSLFNVMRRTALERADELKSRIAGSGSA